MLTTAPGHWAENLGSSYPGCLRRPASAAEGAGGHCEMGNRSLLNGRVLDWLDEQFDTPC